MYSLGGCFWNDDDDDGEGIFVGVDWWLDDGGETFSCHFFWEGRD